VADITFVRNAVIPSIPLLLLLVSSAPPADSAPIIGTVGFVRPNLIDPSCIVANLRRTAGPPYDGVVRVKFAVLADGTMGSFEAYGDVPDYVARSVRQVAEGCTFKPGTRADGTPVAMWMVLPIKYLRLSMEARGVTNYGMVFGRAGPANWAETMDDTPAVSTHVSTRLEAGEAEPGCIARSFKAPGSLAERLEFDFRFVISANGGATDFRYPPQATPEIQERLKEAVEQCPLVPGLGSNGLPVFGAATVTIRYAPPFASELERNPRLQQVPRLLDSGCVQSSLQALGPDLAATVLLLVSKTGAPSDFQVEPKDLSAVTQGAIFGALQGCQWAPAIGFDDKPVAARTTVVLRSR
jgi:hypothetical protein